MRRFCQVFLSLAGLLLPVSSAADAAEKERDRTDSNKPLSAADEIRFRALVKEGARAAKQGRLSSATNAYSKALLIHMDPLIAGRLGLLLVHYPDARSHVDAAIGLYNAITQHAGESRAERKAFLDAYDIVQEKVCALHVITNHTNALVQIDDGLPAKSFGRFWQYVAPGKHELLGTLEGYHELRQTVDCAKGKRFDVSLDFTAKDAESETVEQVPEKRVVMDPPAPPPKAAKSLPPEAPPETPPEAPPETPKRRPLYLSVGPTMVLGVAPSPSFGISLSTVHDVESVPIQVGTRAAYAVGPLANVPIDIFSFTGLAGPCKRGAWLYACGFASVNVIKPLRSGGVPSAVDTIALVVPGLGFGIGVRRALLKSVTAYAHGDATILTERTALIVPTTRGTSTLWEGSTFLASLSLGLEFAR